MKTTLVVTSSPSASSLHVHSEETTTTATIFSTLPEEIWALIRHSLDDSSLLMFILTTTSNLRKGRLTTPFLFKLKRYDFFVNVVKHGHVNLLTFLRQIWPTTKLSELDLVAGSHGQFEILKSLYSEPMVDYYSSAGVINAVTALGRLDILEWLIYSRKRHWNYQTHSVAALNGHLEILKWLRVRGCSITLETITNATLGGHLDILKWIAQTERYRHLFHLRNDDEFVCNQAAIGGHFEVMKWAIEEIGCPFDERVVENCARYNHLKLLKWLVKEKNCPWDRSVCIAAARAGNFEILKWARNRGASMSKTRVIMAAIDGGNLELLEWCILKGGRLTLSAFDLAASHAPLQVLRLLRQYDCPWDSTAVRSAARSGDITKLVYLLDNGCPYDINNVDWLFELATSGGHVDIVKYLENRFPLSFDYRNVLFTAISSQSYLIMEWLKELNPLLMSQMVQECCRYIVRNGSSRPMLEWLISQFNLVLTDDELPLLACKTNSFERLRWLVNDMKCPFNYKDCMTEVFNINVGPIDRSQFVKFLQKHHGEL
jgi:hypothetical protein